ncbi:MAG: TerC family protein [Gemmataceae bacterium]|nr:TerC family protein [Gemmataceae bacterium]
MELLFTVDNMVALATLTALEIVLGIDNIVFLAILAGKLPQHQQASARRIGLSLAMIMRIALLLTLGWIVGLTGDLFTFPRFWTSDPDDVYGVSGRDLIMLVGGLFLIGKATYEIHDKLEGNEATGAPPAPSSFGMTIVQIVLIDIVFSLDSVITAVGMVQTRPDAAWVGLTIMIAAVIIAVVVMLFCAGAIADFVHHHPTMKMLALSFLILIGTSLVAEGLHVHLPKGYVYFAMAFSLGVELLNLRMRKVSVPVELHQTYVQTGADPAGPAAASAKS